MTTRSWTSPWMQSAQLTPALALLDAAGYERGWNSIRGPGSYLCDEEPMYQDGTYLSSLVVCEDPKRPVIEQLQALLTQPC